MDADKKHENRCMVREREQVQRRRLRRFAVIGFAISAHLCGQVPKRSEPVSTTLCEVVNHSDKFDGKLVRFRATFVSDGIERSIFVQRGCKLGIVPLIDPDDQTRPSLDAFNRAVSQGGPGTADKIVVGIFTGRFAWNHQPKRTLDLVEVDELEVKPSIQANKK
jgi:hypothetical protein